MADAAIHGRRNGDIECLRALAVIGVAFHHMQDNLFNPGLPALYQLRHYLNFWYGVDLFFAISGFVIARSLLPQMAGARDNRAKFTVIAAFWIRRCWRLLPSAWLWLGLILLLVVGFNRSGTFGGWHANLMSTLAGLFDVANFRFADAFFRYDYGTSFVYWSLSLEEQFYLLLPLLVLCLRKRIGLLMVAVFIVQLCLLRTIWLKSVRTDALALGVLLAIAATKPRYASLNPRMLLRLGWLRVALPCALLVLLGVLASGALDPWRFRISAIALVSAALVWLASYDEDYLLPNGVIKQLLVWIGARSYAIYLIHVPAYFVLFEINFRLGHVMSPWQLALLAPPLIAVTADLNYRYVEQPLRRRGRLIAENFERRRENLPPDGSRQATSS